MVCSVCGTHNDEGFKFCVKCGSNIENPNEVNYETVDRGNYHTEDDYSESSGGFTMGEGTFIIRDTAPPSEKKSMYTSDELNKSEEEFDFSMYDEPAMPAVNPPQPIQQPPVQQPAYPQQSVQPANPYMQQPVMYSQPQIIGYDPNGMPIYSQPQPVMYQQQPQFMGYDQNGMPVQNMVQGMYTEQPQIPAEPEKTEEKPEESDNKQAFWDFFNEGKKESTPQKEEKDFFGKFKADTIDPKDPFADIDNRRKQRLSEKNQNSGVMGNMPVVDGSKLEKNDSSRINNLYMRQIKDSTSDDLTVGTGKHKNRVMEETQEVDASKLSENLNVKSRVSMGYTDDVNAEDIEQASKKHREALMAQADHSVEAMPKKVKYESELDKIELPEYMQAKKTVRDNNPEIPSLPEV